MTVIITIPLDFSVRLQVVPTNISTAWRWVNVTLNNVKYPKNDDWIGLFTISENSSSIDAKHHAPVKFKVKLTKHMLDSTSTNRLNHV